MRVPLGEFKEDHFLALVVDVVQQAIGTDAKPILGGELRHDELACELFRPFPFGPWVGRQQFAGGDDGVFILGGDLVQIFLEGALDPFAGEDNLVGQSETHFLKKSFSRDSFPLRILGSCSRNLTQQFLVL